jgi:carbon storage regulator CsrA
VLNLNRYLGERIQIGQDVVIVVREIRGAGGGRPMVKLGIEAPQSTRVMRMELLEDNDAIEVGQPVVSS